MIFEVIAGPSGEAGELGRVCVDGSGCPRYTLWGREAIENARRLCQWLVQRYPDGDKNTPVVVYRHTADGVLELVRRDWRASEEVFRVTPDGEETMTWPKALDIRRPTYRLSPDGGEGGFYLTFYWFIAGSLTRQIYHQFWPYGWRVPSAGDHVALDCGRQGAIETVCMNADQGNGPPEIWIKMFAIEEAIEGEDGVITEGV